MSNTITLALSKGRIFDASLPLLKAAGIEVLDDPEKSRKLILDTNLPDVRVVLVRATDVPTYVQYGGADLGVTGKDTLLEHCADWGGAAGLYQPLDLRIAKCRMSVAVRADFDYASAVKQGSRLKVATKYVSIARDFFATKGVHVDLIKLFGSMELAPLTGLAVEQLVATQTVFAPVVFFRGRNKDLIDRIPRAVDQREIRVCGVGHTAQGQKSQQNCFLQHTCL